MKIKLFLFYSIIKIDSSKSPHSISLTATTCKQTNMATQHSTECSICAESFTKRRKIIICPSCDYTSCDSCVKRYIIERKNWECMQCHITWSREFLIKSFPTSFVNANLKKMQAEILFEDEKMQFPETMPDVEEYQQYTSLIDKLPKIEEKILKYCIKIQNLNKKLENLRMQKRICEYLEENKTNPIIALDSIRNEERQAIINRQMPVPVPVPIKVKPKPLIPCSFEFCNSYLSGTGQCPGCSNWSCKTCLEFIGKEAEMGHICKEENIQSAKFIRKDTKPCPKCHAFIHKINGCNQMYCTHCNTKFGWRSGEIQTTGLFHNPHYYKAIENGTLTLRPENVENVVCGGFPGTYSFLRKLANIYGSIIVPDLCVEKNFCGSVVNDGRVLPFDGRSYMKNEGKLTYKHHIGKILRCCNHNEAIVVTKLQQALEIEVDNKDLRMAYLLNQIDDKKMCATLVKRQTARQKIRMSLDIIETFQAVCKDLLNNVDTLENTYHRDQGIKIYNQLREIRDYCNNEFMKLKTNYNMTTFYIEQKFKIVKMSTQDYNHLKK
mgnify:CR=1 FL=1